MPVDIPKTSQQIIDNNNYYTPQKFHWFLKEKISMKAVGLRSYYIFLTSLKDENERIFLVHTIVENVNQLVTNSNDFMLF